MRDDCMLAELKLLADAELPTALLAAQHHDINIC